MADEGVGSGGDDFLIGGGFDDGGGVGIRSEDEKDDEEAEGYEQVAKDGYEGRNGGPCVTMIDGRKDQAIAIKATIARNWMSFCLGDFSAPGRR